MGRDLGAMPCFLLPRSQLLPGISGSFSHFNPFLLKYMGEGWENRLSEFSIPVALGLPYFPSLGSGDWAVLIGSILALPTTGA